MKLLNSQKTVRVLIADGTRIHTQLLADALRPDPYFDIVTATSHSQDLVQTAISRKVDLVVISSRVDDDPLRGLEIFKKIRTLRTQIRGVILLDSEKREIVLAAFRSGATGLFSRDEPLGKLSQCVRQVHSGEIWATGGQMALALEALVSLPVLHGIATDGFNGLSKRELDVVQSVAEGLSNREIAARLGLSQHTVKNYLFRVFDKLGVSSRIELLYLTLNRPHSNLAKEFAEDGSTLSFSACQRAAGQGVPTAQIALARTYMEGKNVKKDPAMAYVWYLTCEKNIDELKDAIALEKRKIAELLTTEEILDAQKAALEHLKKPSQPTTRETNHSPIATAGL